MILSINNREISCPKNDELSNEFIFSETCVFWILCTSVFPFWWHIGFFCCCVVLPSKTQCCRMKNLLHFGIKIILDIFFIFFHNMLNLQNGKFESYFNDENCQKGHKIWLSLLLRTFFVLFLSCSHCYSWLLFRMSRFARHSNWSHSWPENTDFLGEKWVENWISLFS